jgi:hypothetical protein
MDDELDPAWLHKVRAALVASDLVEPPAAVRERARQLFVSDAPSHATLIARLRASLVFDSRRVSPARAGVRSIGIMDGPWQLLYRGGDVDVDLLVRPNQDGRTLSVRGQALPLKGGIIQSGVVEAVPADAPRGFDPAEPVTPSARTELEPTGEFALAHLEPGRYDVLLRFGAREIELSDLEL